MLLLASHHKRIHSLAYSADGGTLYAVVSDPVEPLPDGVVPDAVMWHLGSDGEPEAIPCPGGIPPAVSQLAPLPDGRVLCRCGFVRERVAYVLDPTGVRRPVPFDLPSNGYWSSVSISPTADQLAVADGGYGHNCALVCVALPFAAGDRPTFTVNGGTEGTRAFRFVEFHPDGERLMSVEDRRIPERPVITFCWRNAADGSVIPSRGRMVELPGRTAQAKLGAGGSRLLVRYANCLVSYDTARPTKDAVRVVSESTKHFTDMAVHPDGRRVFATCNDTTVREFDAVTLQEFKGFGWQIGRLRCVAIAPDGLTAAAGSDTGKVIVWDLE